MKDTRCLQSQICDKGMIVPIKSKQTLPKPGGGTLGSEPGFPPVGGILTTLSEAPNFMILQRLDSSEVDGLLSKLEFLDWDNQGIVYKVLQICEASNFGWENWHQVL